MVYGRIRCDQLGIYVKQKENGVSADNTSDDEDLVDDSQIMEVVKKARTQFPSLCYFDTYYGSFLIMNDIRHKWFESEMTKRFHLIPLHHRDIGRDGHWTLLIFDMSQKVALSVDSLKLAASMRDVKRLIANSHVYKFTVSVKQPRRQSRQQDDVSCGRFVMRNLLFAARHIVNTNELPLDFP